jgi:putative transposase
VGLGRATYYRPVMEWAQVDTPVMAALTAVVTTHPRWGFWKCFDRLRLDGHPWNPKRVWRVYCQLRLNLPRRTKKRLPVRPRQSKFGDMTASGAKRLKVLEQENTRLK